MNIALIGYGKMGKAIEAEVQRMAEENPGMAPQIVLKIDLSNQNEFNEKNLKQADVAIEFTTPETAYGNIITCFDAGVPVVCGTTGWTKKLPELKKLCAKRKKTLFYSSNFSIGVNLFFEINRRLAELMKEHPEYDVSVHEVHHTEKKDAPSGTAIVLANEIIGAIRRKKTWVNDAATEPDVLSVRSYRQKDVPGIHIVNYESEFDSIEIKHTAHSRRGFALGALHAARWVQGKKGFFGMKDMLGL
ncbi:MAG TPA: 4-hydroxy-tetrahydrodipicolinate reductase [Chitinophagales bacterium]|nr:4-hydroxy-tetrahydrodipicolinate reductase [Chitinophagales bacterium]